LQVERETEWIQQSKDPEALQKRLQMETEKPKRVYGSIDGATVRIEERNEDNKKRLRSGVR
jgi:hypothetical protein